MYTDGASRGNPGRAACGGVIYLAKDKLSPESEATADPIHRFGTPIGYKTNNEAEYRGLIQGYKQHAKWGLHTSQRMWTHS